MRDSLSGNFKSNRILSIYTRLLNGEVINKAYEAERYGVDKRSIQRDLDDIRAFLDERRADNGVHEEIVYSRSLGGYCLRSDESKLLTNGEILAVCKILLESRAFRREEMEQIIKKLVNRCVPEQKKKLVKELVSNEMFHYIEPHHGRKFLQTLWELGTAVKEYRFISVTYEKQNGDIAKRILKPVGIMFSEYYFYLTAFIEGADKSEFHNPDDLFPTIYRIDRIRELKLSDKHFDIPYKERFEEGEFRKRIQFMYGGKLRKIRFKYTGASVEAVLDRLPTAKIVEKVSDGYIITAEVFGDGIDMWIRSQGDNVKLL